MYHLGAGHDTHTSIYGDCLVHHLAGWTSAFAIHLLATTQQPENSTNKGQYCRHCRAEHLV